MSNFSYEIGSDNIAIIKWDVPDKKFNVLTLEGISEIENILEKIFENNNLKGVIISSNKDDFSAGMDLNVLANLQDETKSKEEIYKFGDDPENFYIVLSGIVSIKEKNPVIEQWDWAHSVYETLIKWKKEDEKGYFSHSALFAIFR